MDSLPGQAEHLRGKGRLVPNAIPTATKDAQAAAEHLPPQRKPFLMAQLQGANHWHITISHYMTVYTVYLTISFRLSFCDCISHFILLCNIIYKYIYIIHLDKLEEVTKLNSSAIAGESDASRNSTWSPSGDWNTPSVACWWYQL